VEGNEMTKRFSLFDLAHEVPSRIYPVVEYVITLDVNDDNDVVTLEKLDIGGRNETYALKEGIPFSKDPDSKWAKTVQYETEKHCLANLLQWLDGHVTIVHIPDKDVNGMRIPIDIIGRLIRIASKQFGFPLATASGYTAGSYEFVHEPEFWRLVKYLNKKTDVYDVLNYLGRIFTDISKDGMFQHDQLFVPLPSDGRDGNVPCDPAVSSTPNDWIIGKNGQMKLRANLVQISGIAIDKRHDLRAIGKALANVNLTRTRSRSVKLLKHSTGSSVSTDGMTEANIRFTSHVNPHCCYKTIVQCVGFCHRGRRGKFVKFSIC